MTVDTLGGWHPSALAAIKKLGCQLARNDRREDNKVVAVLLVRDNVAMQFRDEYNAPRGMFFFRFLNCTSIFEVSVMFIQRFSCNLHNSFIIFKQYILIDL